MSLLVQNPHPEAFATLPDFSVALENFQDKQIATAIQKLGNIFVKHGVCDDFGLSMIHRHFDLSSSEVLVQIFNEDHTKSLSVPWEIKGKYAVPPKDEIFELNGFQQECNKSYVIPINWRFGKNADIVPFEFWATNDNSLPDPKPEFIQELHLALKEVGIDEYVGIRRTVDIQGKNAWETTPEGTRANLVVLGEKPNEVVKEDMTRVLWGFDRNGDVGFGALFCQLCMHCHEHKN